MSCYHITYKDGKKVMTPVTSREALMRLRSTGAQRALINQVRAGNKAAKMRLAQFNYSCLPNSDGTLKGASVPSGSVGMDIDHIAPETLNATIQKIVSLRDELGLLLLEKSASGDGLHVVFKRIKEFSQVENLQKAANLIGVNFDDGAKDITRVFFATTADPDELIFITDELFESEAAPFSSTPSSEGSSSELKNSSAETQGVVKELNEQQTFDEDYEGVPYTDIVEALEEQLGGIPEHGSRNQFIFAMACHLRYICDHNPKWIAQVLPDYGEDRTRWFSTILSACKRSQTKNKPKLLERALNVAKGQQESEGDFPPPPMPKRLPPLIKLLVSKTPRIYRPAVAHAVFPALATHLWRTRFKYIDNVEHEATLMNVLMAGTGAGKSCITAPIDYIMADIRERDKINLERERRWKEEMMTKGANKDKSARPEGLVIQEVDADMTNAAFVLRLSESEDHFLYVRMNELDQFDALKTNGRSKSQFQIMCLAFDPGNLYGQTRVGSQSVNARVCIRFNWNASSTIGKGQNYFRSVLQDGPISRINFCTIPEQPIGAPMPKYGKYDDNFAKELKPYIERLCAARGQISCPKVFNLAKKLCQENAEFSELCQSRVYENLSFRANVIAFLKAMVLYVAQGEFGKLEEDFIRWSLRYDLWCKMRFFGDAIAKSDSGEVQKRGPKSLLDELPEHFSREDATIVRRKAGLDANGTKYMLNNWVSRGRISTADDEYFVKINKN